jgi:hypothetical protein
MILIAGSATLDRPARAQNRLTNGSFEAPDINREALGLSGLAIPGWRVEGSNPDGTPATVDLFEGSVFQTAHGQGRQALELVGTPGAPRVSQTIQNVGGRLLRLTGWYAHHPGLGDAPARFAILINGSVFQRLEHSNARFGVASAANMRWQRFDFQFRAPSNGVIISFQDTTSPDLFRGSVIDGIAVTALGADPPVGGGGPQIMVPSLLITIGLQRVGDEIVVHGVAANRGSAAAQFVIRSAVLTAFNPLRFVGPLNLLPLDLGIINPGEERRFVLRYPGSVGVPGQRASLAIMATGHWQGNANALRTLQFPHSFVNFRLP